MDIIILMSAVWKPGVPFSTTNPRVSSGRSPSNFAQTRARPEMGAMEIHILFPMSRKQP